MKFSRATKSNTELVGITKREFCVIVRNKCHLTILFDLRMFGAVLGEHASTMREKEYL